MSSEDKFWAEWELRFALQLRAYGHPAATAFGLAAFSTHLLRRELERPRLLVALGAC